MPSTPCCMHSWIRGRELGWGRGSATTGKNRYNNGLKVKLVSIFADVEEKREEREKSLALVLASSLVRKHRHLWAQIKIHVRKSRKEKVRHGIT